MQSEEPVRHGSEEVRPSAEPLPQHAEAVPLVQTTTNPHADGGTRAPWPRDADSGFRNCSSTTLNGQRTRKGRGGEQGS